MERKTLHMKKGETGALALGKFRGRFDFLLERGRANQ
jgi:hypothetical protein